MDNEFIQALKEGIDEVVKSRVDEANVKIVQSSNYCKEIRKKKRELYARIPEELQGYILEFEELESKEWSVLGVEMYKYGFEEGLNILKWLLLGNDSPKS